MKKVAIYMRVSTANQEEQETIQNQLMELVERIEKDGLVIAPGCTYQDEGWSGSTLERPALDKLRADAKDGKFDIVYSYDRGRISRIFYHQEIVLNELKEIGIEYIGLHDINGVTEEERLMGSVMGIFQEYERLKIAERMRIGKIRKVRENKKLLGYQPKYGYDYLPRIKKGPNARDGKFVINKKQAEVVHLVFQLCAAGKSKYGIQKELFERNIKPKKSERGIWSTGVIDRMLRDTTYMGEHYYNKSQSVQTKNPRTTERYRKTVKGSRISRPKDDWLMIKVEPIVTKELFNTVQDILNRHKCTYKRSNKKHCYLVGGIVHCPCGFKRTGDSSNNSLYYRCNDRLNHPLGTRKCHEKPVSAPVLDELIWRNIGELLSHPQLLFSQAKKWQNENSPIEKRIKVINSILEDLYEQEKRYSKAYGLGTMPEPIYTENVKDLNTKREVLISEMEPLKIQLANSPSLPLEKLVESVVELLGDLDYAKKRQIIEKLVTKVVATKDEVTVWGHIPVLGDKEKYEDFNKDNQGYPDTTSNLSEIGLNVKYRNCRPTECRQIDAL